MCGIFMKDLLKRKTISIPGGGKAKIHKFRKECRANDKVEDMKEKYTDYEYIQGHYNNYGVDAFLIKNPIWKIKENNKVVYLMYCEKDSIC